MDVREIGGAAARPSDLITLAAATWWPPLEGRDIPIAMGMSRSARSRPTRSSGVNVRRLRPIIERASSRVVDCRVGLWIIATGRAIGLSIEASLAWAFERLGTHRDVFGLDLDAITPVAFKRSRG